MQPTTSTANHQWIIYKDIYGAKESLAYDNSFVRYLPPLNAQAETQASPVSTLFHWYPLDKPTILLGTKDTRLKAFDTAKAFLKDAGYQVIVRPHGGMAVVVDDGVVNLSLIQSMKDTYIEIDTAYQAMTDFLCAALKPLGLTFENYEMVHSYCPGRFDININGQKVGGSAQKRFKEGITTAIYLSVNGNQDQRVQLIREFYRIGQADASYPIVEEAAMTTLRDQVSCELTPKDVYDLILAYLHSHGPVLIGDYHDPALNAFYQKAITKLTYI